MAVWQSILAGVAVNLLKAVSNKTVKALKQLFSEDELKSVLEKAYLEFKKSIPKENKEKEEEKLLQVFEKFFADDRIIYEFRSAFDGKGDDVNVDILAEVFVPICLDKGIELKDFDFFYQAMSDVIKKIVGLAQTGKETLIIKLPEPPGMEPNHTLARHKYLRQLRTHNQRLQFTGIPDLKEKEDISLPSVFVMQRVVESVPVSDYERMMREKADTGDKEFTGDEIQLRKMMIDRTEEKKEPVKFDTVFEEKEGGRFVVLGKPGSGKSTLLKYLMLEAVEKMLKNPREIPSLSLPILVEIRKFENALSKTIRPDYNILDYLYDSMRKNYSLTLPKDFFEKYLDSGRVLLLFDGLDEVATESRRAEIRQMIGSFVTGFSTGNTVIVTSRISGYSRAQFSTTDYRHFTLEDFNEEEVEEFIHKWYQSRLLNPAEAVEKAGDLKEAIEKKPAIKELAKNPLLLTIIVIIHRYEAQLPEDRLELFHKATEALLYTWDIGKGIIDEKFKLSHRRRFLEKVAFHLQSIEKGDEAGTVMERGELYNILLSEFCRVFDCEKWQAREMVDEFLEVIRTRAGLLVEQAADQYGFVHKTFQEYFAAMWIANESNDNYDLQIMINYVDQFIDNAFWQETLLLALRALPIRQTQKILEHILNRDPRGIESYFYHNHYFVMKFIAEQGQWLNNPGFVEKQVNDFFDFSWIYGQQRVLFLNRAWNRFKDWVSLVTDSFTRSVLFEKLLTLVEDVNKKDLLRIDCAESVGNLGYKEEAAAVLLELAKDTTQEGRLRRSCAETVGKLDYKEEAAAVLLELAEDTKQLGRLRRSCAKAVGNLGYKNKIVAERLLDLAEDAKQSVKLRRSCAKAVGNLGYKDKAVVERLLDLAEDAKQSVKLRRFCAESVDNLGYKDKIVAKRLLDLAEDAKQSVKLRRSCASAVGNLGYKDKAAAVLLDLAEDAKQSVKLRRSCASAVGHLGYKDKAAAVLLELAKDSKQLGRLRRYCAKAAGKLGYKDKAAAVLLELADDANQEGGLRRDCAKALGHLGYKDKASAVLLELADDANQEGWLRQSCAEAVGHLGLQDKAAEILLDLAEDAKQKVLLRRDCAYAVGKLGEKDKAVDILIKLYLAQPDKYEYGAQLIYDSLWEMTEV